MINIELTKSEASVALVALNDVSKAIRRDGIEPGSRGMVLLVLLDSIKAKIGSGLLNALGEGNEASLDAGS